MREGDREARSSRVDRVFEGKGDAYYELFRRSADAILIIEGETFVDCNQATVEMLRYETRDQLLRTHPSELSPATQPDGRSSFEKANEMIAVALKEGSHRFEWDHQRADGEVFPVEVLLTAIHEGGKSLLHVVWRDITERKRLEKQLRHAQKMEAVGRLAGGIAHDFNNILVAILGNAELIKQQFLHRPDVLENVEEIQRSGDSAAGLVRQLLAFSREQELKPRVVDLNVVVSDLANLLRRLIGDEIELQTKFSGATEEIRADLGQLEQVVVNLVTNAREAMPHGGRLTLEVRRIHVSGSDIGLTEDLDTGSYAQLIVSDTGKGMSEEIMRRAFDPFFSTKETGEGSGLGLATVYGIVQQSGGSVGIVSTLGLGSTIKVFLPIASPEPGPTEPEADKVVDGGGVETVLVAEDEQAVSFLVVKVLESRGYRVFLANDGAEALEILRGNQGEIDLLLTDVVMPNLGGVELVEAMRNEGIEIPVLFASGYTNDALGRFGDVGKEVDLIEKPFTPNELVARVQSVLDRSRVE